MFSLFAFFLLFILQFMAFDYQYCIFTFSLDYLNM